MTAATPDLRPHGPLDLWRGFALPLRALGLVFSTGRLALLTFAVAAITVGAVALLAFGLWHGAPALVERFWAAPEAWWAAALHRLLEALVFVLLLFIGASTLPMLLAAPLMDPISAATERLLGHEPQGGGLGRAAREVLRSWRNALVRVSLLAAGQLLLLPVLLIPGVGEAAWTALGWAWTAIWVAVAYLDVPMSRHLYSYRQELQALRARPLVCLGFGAAVALMLWVPLLNFFFVPVSVVAGTLLFRALLAARVMEAPPASR